MPPTTLNSLSWTEIDGFRVANASSETIIASLIEHIVQGLGGWLLTLNLQMISQATRDSRYRALCQNICYAVADGMPIVWASTLARRAPIVERTTGIKISAAILNSPHIERVALIGGKNPKDIATKFIPSPKRQYTIVDGVIIFNEETLASIIALLRRDNVQVALIALGSPKADYVANAIAQALPSVTTIGIGSSLEALSGLRHCAPQLIQNLGLEWLFRLLNEPRHLWRRYLLLYPFGAISLIQFILRSRSRN